MAKLDWSKACRRSALRFEAHQKTDGKRQAALTAFVQKHGLACFKCRKSVGPWAKTGVVQSSRYAWALCVPCAQTSGKQPGRGTEEPTHPAEPAPRHT